jgi:hypothetical protein
MHERDKTEIDGVAVKEVVLKFKRLIKLITSKWVFILICCVIMGIAGLVYSIFKKNVYTATCTFVLEDKSQGGLMSQYAGLASLAGIDLPGGSEGIFSGENIFALYRSRLMIEKTLLTEVDFDGKKSLLIERFIKFNKLRAKWKNNDKIDSITFTGDSQKFNRKQDSIITDVVDIINKKYLDVKKSDKKLIIIEVDVKSIDELFSKKFTEQLVENVNEFYVTTKTKKSFQNLQTLQKQADSVRAVLNSAISGVASAIDASPNANPALVSLRVPSQKKQVDVQASTAIYSEIVKNLEISKISFRQEKPLIQVVDPPVLPLPVDHFGKIKGIVTGFILGFFIAIVIVLGKKTYQVIMFIFN